MVNIPDSVWALYRETADDFINLNFGEDCVLVYPPLQTECPNCVVDLIGKKSASIYKSGGPEPFTNGMICPICNGEGFHNEEPTETIKLRVYWSPKDWVKTGTTLAIPDGSIQVIGFLYDLPKVMQSAYIKIVNKNDAYLPNTFVRIREPFYHGFKKNRYFSLYLGQG